MPPDRPQWICHQLGSREHYSIPRAIHRVGSLGLLQTDFWTTRLWSAIGRLGQIPSLGQRSHPDLPTAKVRAFNVNSLLFELRSKVNPRDPWASMIRRNHWFQTRCLSGLKQTLSGTDPGSPRTVFAYSYAAKEIFKVAKAHQARCVLGQIDPGPREFTWVREQLGNNPLKEIDSAPPASYWQDWEEETRLADRIIVNSEWSRGLLVKAGVDDEKITLQPVAYEPPDPLKYPPFRVYPGKFDHTRLMRVLFLGQLIPRKGIGVLIECIQALANEPIFFDLAGPVSIPLPEFLEDHPKVRVHGPVHRDQADKLYDQADIFVLPTFSDGFAITQLEALSHRLPIIASPYCGKVVQSGRTGYLLKDVTLKALREQLMHCLHHPKELQSMANHPRDWTPYSLKALAENLLQ